MIYVGAGLAGALVVFVLVNLLLGCKVFWMLWNWRRPLLGDGACPKTAVLLCLRGPDPFLHRTTEAILQQDYPEYEIYVVVDSLEDPAARVVGEVVRNRNAQNVFIEPLTERRTTCSLKCSAVLQAVSRLKDTHEIVAFVDADTIPHRTWLRELVTAVMDEKVGAVTGNRWFIPAGADWGTLVRYLWNVPAVAQTILYRLAWGGAMAIRSSVFRETNLLEKWSKAFCEDTMLHKHLTEWGLEFRPVPSVLMANRETTTLGGVYHFARRQMLNAKLYHPSFWLVILHFLCVAPLPLIIVAFAGVALMVGEYAAAIVALSGLGVYVVASVALLVLLESAARRILRARGEPTGWCTPGVLLRLIPAFVITHFWYAAVMISSLALRTVEWRKIIYRVEGAWQITLIEDKPFPVLETSERSL